MLEKKNQTFFGGVAVLAIGAVSVKIIGALFKLPLFNILGDVGTGHFNNAYAIFNLLLTISTAGLPVALSKSIAEANALGRRGQAQKTFRVAFMTFLALGIVSFFILLFGAPALAAWMGNTGAVYAIQALAPCVLAVCVMAAFRGYAQGQGDMLPTSVSQIIEAVLKLIVGTALAWFIASSAIRPDSYRIELAAAGAIGGVSVGAVTAMIYLAFRHLHTRRREPRGALGDTQTTGTILSTLFKIAIPITLGSSIVSIVTLVDTNLVQHRLQDAVGLAQEAAVGLYGTYQGAVVLYNLPAALMSPLTASIIPAVSAARARRDVRGAHKISESALRMAALIAMPAGIGLTALATPIFSLILPKFDATIGGPLLSMLGIASIFVCIMLICTSILQANGVINLPIFAALLGGVIKIIVNYVLVGNPDINIYGAPIGTLCCFGVAAVLDVLLILRVIPNPPNFLRAFAKPLVASLLMGGAAWAANGLLARVLPAKIAVVGAIGVGGVVYLILVVALRVMSTEDIALMPKGDKIAKFLRLK